MILSEIEKKFKEKFTICNGIILLKREDAIDFIDACEDNKVNILGIDGFFLQGKSIQPSLENSVDFTSITQSSNDVYDKARKFIMKSLPSLYFEVVHEELIT